MFTACPAPGAGAKGMEPSLCPHLTLEQGGLLPMEPVLQTEGRAGSAHLAREAGQQWEKGFCL